MAGYEIQTVAFGKPHTNIYPLSYPIRYPC